MCCERSGRSDQLAQSSLRFSLGSLHDGRAKSIVPSRSVKREVTRLRSFARPGDVNSAIGEAMSEAHYSPLVVEHFEQPAQRAAASQPATDVIAASAGRRRAGRAVRSQCARARRSHRGGALRGLRLSALHRCRLAGSASACRGPTQDELRRWSWREAADALEFPPEKRGRLLILEDAVQALSDAWQRRLDPHECDPASIRRAGSIVQSAMDLHARSE